MIRAEYERTLVRQILTTKDLKSKEHFTGKLNSTSD